MVRHSCDASYLILFLDLQAPGIIYIYMAMTSRMRFQDVSAVKNNHHRDAHESVLRATGGERSGLIIVSDDAEDDAGEYDAHEP